MQNSACFSLPSTLQQYVGGVYVSLEEPHLALPHFERAIALYEKSLGPNNSEMLGTMTDPATAYEAAGRASESRRTR